MKKIRFGWISPVVGIPESKGPIVMAQMESVLPVVAQHFDSVWVYDHLYGFERLTDPYLECWTTMTWLAATFPSLHVGSIVMSIAYRPPALLAKMAATLQAFSSGRFILGIGAGWREEEYHAYGYAFPRPAVRIRQLEEGVKLMRRMWTEPTVTFRGEHFRVQDARCEPRPETPIPIMIGGAGEQLMLRLVAQQADWWNISGSVDTYAHKLDVLRRHCDAVGRDDETIVKTVMIEDVELPKDSRASAQIAERLRSYVELGVTHFMFDFGHVTDVEPVHRLAEEVIPQTA